MAMAWAPPAAWTSVTPSSAQAARTAGLGSAVLLRRRGDGDLRHPGDLRGDDVHDHRGRVGGQAARHVHAGPAHRDEPPGDGGPRGDVGHGVGAQLCAVHQGGAGGSTPPARPAGPGPGVPSAPSSAGAGTRVAARSTPSNRRVYSRTAAAPRRRTSSHTGRTCSVAASTSSTARGSTGASFSLLSWAAGHPRRSILESTRPVYGAGAGRRRTRPHGGHSAGPPAHGAHSGPRLIPGPGPSRTRRPAGHAPLRRVPCRLPSARPPAARTR